jgi:hypothetical protein
MITLKYIGNNQPKGMIIEVEEINIDSYIDSGEYIKVDASQNEFKTVSKSNLKKVKGMNNDDYIKQN